MHIDPSQGRIGWHKDALCREAKSATIAEEKSVMIVDLARVKQKNEATSSDSVSCKFAKRCDDHEPSARDDAESSVCSSFRGSAER